MSTIEHPLGSDSDEEDDKLFRSHNEEMGVIRCLELISAVNVLVSVIRGSAQDDFNKILRETFKDKTDDLLGKISDSHALSANIGQILTQTKSLSLRDFYSLALELASLLDENAGFLFNTISEARSPEPAKAAFGLAVLQQITKIKGTAEVVKKVAATPDSVFAKFGLVENMNFLIQGLHSILSVAGTDVRLPDGEKRKFEDYLEPVCLVAFYKAYDEKLRKSTKDLIGLGWVRKKFIESGVQRDWNLKQIIAHAFSGGKRTLEVLKDLEWLEKVEDKGYGHRGISDADIYSVTKTAPKAFEKAFIAHFDGPAMTPDLTPDSTPRTSVLDKPSSPSSPRSSR